MLTIDATAERRAGVTFVTAVVHNGTARRRRVRVEATGDGPVWPPRRQGVPERGWDDGGVTVGVGAGERCPLGFATPAPPTDDPVTVAESTVVDEADETVPATPEGVVRTLGDPSPPPDAVGGGADHGADPAGVADQTDEESERPAPESTTPESPTAPPETDDPAALAAWLAGVADRVALARGLEGASADEAATALAESDVESAAALEETLTAVARTARGLAERADDGTETAATLRRLS